MFISRLICRICCRIMWHVLFWWSPKAYCPCFIVLREREAGVCYCIIWPSSYRMASKIVLGCAVYLSFIWLFLRLFYKCKIFWSCSRRCCANCKVELLFLTMRKYSLNILRFQFPYNCFYTVIFLVTLMIAYQAEKSC
jgi:hypothetical protein